MATRIVGGGGQSSNPPPPWHAIEFITVNIESYSYFIHFRFNYAVYQYETQKNTSHSFRNSFHSSKFATMFFKIDILPIFLRHLLEICELSELQ